ncbi:hypothetical protein QJ856_gp0300 [Tupanvirus deep ocean]|uniref:Uncharacterized protein n=2 Tax=Tupanvirus TaxID=2094720 RepID=A0AC62A9N4_9VIRU|nr:hypothetical protein QJ856_gp0300 [Tupanvirus deep ocean]QKU34434.1 hypothetical protein [Tupanvirus deep ocean]
MKILILCMHPNNLIKADHINALSTIYAYHFKKWLEIHKDVEITFDDFYMNATHAQTLGEFDFCILTVNRGALTMNQNVYQIIRKKIKYHIITLCGSNKLMGSEDLLLYMMGKRKNRAMRVFWGADPELLFPQKSKNTINILVDHQYYGDKSSSLFSKDRTRLILDSLLAYQKRNPNIVIKHIGNGVVNTVTDSYVIEPFKQGLSMDFREIYKHYNEAHIYVVTHPECLGLTTIECGCAGAMVVQPNGYIKREIINNLYHYNIMDINKINWAEIIQNINIGKAIAMSKTFLYQNTVERLYQYMVKIMNSPVINSSK